MVVLRGESEETLNQLFRALADGTRRDILVRSLTETPSVSALAARYDMSFAAVQKHVAVLERAGLISRGRDAQSRPCRLEAGRLQEATEWMERYRRCWEERFDRLDGLLEAMKAEEKRDESGQ